MNKLDEFWRAHYVDQQIVWPEGQADRDALARKFFGFGFIEALDSWLGRADDLLNNPVSTDESLGRNPTRAAEEKAYRECFMALTPDQKAAVRKLIYSSVHGVLFGALVHIDQVPRGNFEIFFVDRQMDRSPVRARVFPVSESGCDDLHDELYDWVWDFSQYAQRLMTRVPNNHGGWTDQWV